MFLGLKSLHMQKVASRCVSVNKPLYEMLKGIVGEWPKIYGDGTSVNRICKMPKDVLKIRQAKCTSHQIPAVRTRVLSDVPHNIPAKE